MMENCSPKIPVEAKFNQTPFNIQGTYTQDKPSNSSTSFLSFPSINPLKPYKHPQHPSIVSASNPEPRISSAAFAISIIALVLYWNPVISIILAIVSIILGIIGKAKGSSVALATIMIGTAAFLIRFIT